MTATQVFEVGPRATPRLKSRCEPMTTCHISVSWGRFRRRKATYFISHSKTKRRLQRRMSKLLPAGTPWPRHLTLKTEWHSSFQSAEINPMTFGPALPAALRLAAKGMPFFHAVRTRSRCARTVSKTRLRTKPICVASGPFSPALLSACPPANGFVYSIWTCNIPKHASGTRAPIYRRHERTSHVPAVDIYCFSHMLKSRTPSAGSREASTLAASADTLSGGQHAVCKSSMPIRWRRLLNFSCPSNSKRGPSAPWEWTRPAMAGCAAWFALSSGLRGAAQSDIILGSLPCRRSSPRGQGGERVCH
jgi:hypothetical protein